MKAIKLLLLFISCPLFGQQLSFALEQINGQAIIDQGLTGKGVKVGVIDGGFLKTDKIETLQHLFENNQIAGYRDYLDSSANDFDGSRAFDDVHGTEVLELIAGYSKERNVQYGLATNATYYLARTDHGGYEKRKEEEYAIEAMEWMAQEGVRIINLSLGYNFGYTDKRENYTPRQMDGKSTIVTQAVDRISKEYGILFIVAAGNDGENKWKIVGSPGDAKSALTVGATKFKVWDDMNYTSKGPEWLDYVKPEIACYASTGTSFSAPVITGLAACLLERHPNLSGQELKEVLIESGNLALPNNYIGYGVPDAITSFSLLKDEEIEKKNSVRAKKSHLLELSKPSIYLKIYHKIGWKVVEKETIRTDRLKVKIKQKEDAESSTILWENGVLEIFWE
ncbi:MAG: S8 family serine peptidase [Bacteroidota bacterium]